MMFGLFHFHQVWRNSKAKITCFMLNSQPFGKQYLTEGPNISLKTPISIKLFTECSAAAQSTRFCRELSDTAACSNTDPTTRWGYPSIKPPDESEQGHQGESIKILSGYMSEQHSLTFKNSQTEDEHLNVFQSGGPPERDPTRPRALRTSNLDRTEHPIK